MSNEAAARPADSPRSGLFVIAAPSGAGKTSLVNALLAADPALGLSVSATTRPPRDGERDGIDYRFISSAEFQAAVRRGEFLEHAEVFGHHYGTRQADLEALATVGRDAVLEIDWQGARQVRVARPDCVAVFIVPPSLDALRQRLVRRGLDDAAVIEQRMRAARDELSHWPEFDYLVVNEDFATALADLSAIVRAWRLRRPVQQARLTGPVAELLAKSAGKG